MGRSRARRGRPSADLGEYDDPVALFVPVIRGFNDAGVSYVIVGGLATVLHGHLRVTADIDFVIRLDDANVTRALDVVLSLGYRARLPVDPRDFARPEVRRQWVEEKGMMVLSFFDPGNVAR